MYKFYFLVFMIIATSSSLAHGNEKDFCDKVRVKGQEIFWTPDPLSSEHQALFSKILSKPGGQNSVRLYPKMTIANDGKMKTLVIVSQVSDKDSILRSYLLVTEDFKSFYPVPDTEKISNAFKVLLYQGTYYIEMSYGLSPLSGNFATTLFKLNGNSRENICLF